MPTVVFKESNHGVGVKKEACPAPRPGIACLEVILELSEGGTQLYHSKHKTEEESDFKQTVRFKRCMFFKQLYLKY
jgi:hypothetical protein